MHFSPLAAGQGAGSGTVNPQNGTAVFVAASNVPTSPSAAIPAVVGWQAEYRSAATAAQVVAAVARANAETSDRFEALVFADRAAAGGSDQAIGRNDGLAPAADMAGAHHFFVVAVAPIENSAVARAGNSVMAAESLAVHAVHSSAVDGIDSSVAAAVDNFVAVAADCAAAEIRTVAARAAEWISVPAAAADVVALGEKPAAQAGFGDFARGTALPLTPAS